MTTLTITGNLAADPELSVTQSGRSVARFTVIENRKRRTDEGWEEQEPNAFSVQVWGQQAENVAKSCEKGARVVVSGKIETSRWIDKDSGQARTRQQITADDVAYSLRFHTVTAEKNPRKEPGSGEPQWETAEPGSDVEDETPF